MKTWYFQVKASKDTGNQNFQGQGTKAEVLMRNLNLRFQHGFHEQMELRGQVSRDHSCGVRFEFQAKKDQKTRMRQTQML